MLHFWKIGSVNIVDFVLEFICQIKKFVEVRFSRLVIVLDVFLFSRFTVEVIQ